MVGQSGESSAKMSEPKFGLSPALFGMYRCLPPFQQNNRKCSIAGSISQINRTTIVLCPLQVRVQGGVLRADHLLHHPHLHPAAQHAHRPDEPHRGADHRREHGHLEATGEQCCSRRLKLKLKVFVDYHFSLIKTKWKPNEN